MYFSTFDIIHILAITVQLPLIATLLYKGKYLVSNKLLAFFFFAQVLNSLDQLCWSHFNDTYEIYPSLAYIAFPFFTVWGPCMYLYIRAETMETFRFKPLHLLHFLPFVICSLYFLFAYHIHSIEQKRLLIHSDEVFNFTLRKAYSAVIAFQVLIYNLCAVFVVETYARRYRRRGGLVLSGIKWVRFIIYGYFIACIFNNIASFIFPLTNTAEFSTYFYLSGLMFLLYFSVILIGALLGSHFGRQVMRHRAVSLTEEQVQKLQTRLAPYMEQEKPYLEFNLTLSEMAAGIGFKERQLSTYINTYCYTTFQDYINRFRIEEAKQLLAQNATSGQTILEIAYAAGFNSKSAFNAAFKKHTRTTPSSYKKAARSQKT